MFEDITKRKRPILEKLFLYGFRKDEASGLLMYETAIMEGGFRLLVAIDPKSGSLDTELIEKETGEKYVLYKTNAAGSYVGEIRSEIRGVLEDIVARCYETAVFKSAQASLLIEFVRATYGDELEFLWDQFPEDAVWRRKDNRKWYGIILTVLGEKLGVPGKGEVEIVDFRMDPSKAEETLSRDGYRPGWHMNKKSWFSIVLDGGVSDEELLQRLKESHELAGLSSK